MNFVTKAVRFDGVAVADMIVLTAVKPVL